MEKKSRDISKFSIITFILISYHKSYEFNMFQKLLVRKYIFFYLSRGFHVHPIFSILYKTAIPNATYNETCV